MPESNYNWVCFECHFVIRQAKTYDKIPKCQHCHNDCACLGYKIKIPKKRDDKGWEKLQLTYRQMKVHHLEENRSHIRFRISHLKNEIQRLESKEDNKDRNKLIHSMKEELDKIIKQKI